MGDSRAARGRIPAGYRVATQGQTHCSNISGNWILGNSLKRSVLRESVTLCGSRREVELVLVLQRANRTSG